MAQKSKGSGCFRGCLIIASVPILLFPFSSAQAQGSANQSCYDAYVQCAGACTTSCRVCNKTSTGYELCGNDPKCSGECITDCGDVKRACERDGEAVGQSLDVQPTTASAPTSKPTPQPTSLPQNSQRQPNAKQGQTLDQLFDPENMSWVNVFGINPFEAWLRVKHFIEGAVALDKLTEFSYDTFIQFTPGKMAEKQELERERLRQEWQRNPKILRNRGTPTTTSTDEQEDVTAHVDELLNRTPELTNEIIQKAQADWDAMVNNKEMGKPESPYRLDILKGETQVKLPGENQWKALQEGDVIPEGSTIFTGVDTTTVLSIENKGVIQVLPFTEITISEEGMKQAKEEGKTTTSIELRKGEIEVNVEGGVFTAPILDVHTPAVVAGVRGTHFWVSYDNNLSVVGVYEGNVEVKTKDGKTTTVSPDGDIPGVVVVARHLSIHKVIITTGIIITLTAMAIFFLKRRAVTKPKVRR